MKLLSKRKYIPNINGLFINLLMTLTKTLICIFFNLLCIIVCQGQSNNNKMTDHLNQEINPLLCDPEDGICEIPVKRDKETTPKALESSKKTIKVIYFTDPICSSCWGIEPQLRKLKLEYGECIDIDYRMGGLLPDWSYNSGGISKPSDVAQHWDEASLHYDMPIDGDVWLEDPLDSSYPPSIAFKAAQLQDRDKAILFLRELREMVFLKKKNITQWEHLETAAKKVKLDIKQFKTDFNNQAKVLFEEDLKLSRAYGVRGFPTLFFLDTSGNKEIVYGSKPYAAYEMAILKNRPNLSKSEFPNDWESLFSTYKSLTAREYSELSGMQRKASEKWLNALTEKEKLVKLTTKNGSLWSVK